MAFVPDKPVSRFKPDKAAEPAFEREAREMAGITMADAIAANPMLRMATQASKAIGVPWNMAMGAVGLEGAKVPYAEVERMQERGAKGLGYGSLETTGQDIAGGLMSPLTGAALRTPAAAGALGRIAQGSGFGAVAGLSAGTQDPIATGAAGAAFGGLVPAGIEGVRAVGRTARPVIDLFRGEKGAADILSRYQRKIVGEENVPAVVEALRKGAMEPVPGYRPTSAEAVQGLPAGSPIVAHQRMTAATAGGPSAAFGNRIQEQKTAIKAAYEALDKSTGPMRETALKNIANGVPAAKVTDRIDRILARPGIRQSEVVSKSLNDVKEKILGAVDDNGNINPKDLYTIRKELGTTITKWSKETQTWDKKLTGGLERILQKSIDNAIEGAGGQGWKKYMATYASGRQAIEGTKKVALSAMRPEQRTDLAGGLNIAEQTRPHGPQLLSRTVAMGNFILRSFSAQLEPHIDKVATRRMLNPTELADAIEKTPPHVRSKIIDAMERAGVATAILGSREEQKQME